MHHLGLMLAAAWHVIVVQALISLGTIRNLTDLSRELRGRILEVGGEVVEMAGNVGGQVVLDGSGVGKETGRNGDKDDVEDVSELSILFYFLLCVVVGVWKGRVFSVVLHETWICRVGLRKGRCSCLCNRGKDRDIEGKGVIRLGSLLLGDYMRSQ